MPDLQEGRVGELNLPLAASAQLGLASKMRNGLAGQKAKP